MFDFKPQHLGTIIYAMSNLVSIYPVSIYNLPVSEIKAFPFKTE